MALGLDGSRAHFVIDVVLAPESAGAMSTHLSPGQKEVVRQAIAWCDRGYSPSEDEIEALFAFTERGERKAFAGLSTELLSGWRAAYSNEYAQYEQWKEQGGNPPESPPAAWLYDYFHGRHGEWGGFFPMMAEEVEDALRVGRPAAEFQRIQPRLKRLFLMYQVFHPDVRDWEIYLILQRASSVF